MNNMPFNVELKTCRGSKAIVFGRKPEPMLHSTPLVGVEQDLDGKWIVICCREDEIIGLWEEPHKPCPHCGGENLGTRTLNGKLSIICSKCGGCGPDVFIVTDRENKQAAWAAWDNRDDE